MEKGKDDLWRKDQLSWKRTLEGDDYGPGLGLSFVQ